MLFGHEGTFDKDIPGPFMNDIMGMKNEDIHIRYTNREPSSLDKSIYFIMSQFAKQCDELDQARP